MNEQPIIVMTGATNGFGKEAATELTRRGAHLVLMARSTQKGQAVRDYIHTQNPDASVEIVEGDLSSIESVRDFSAKIKASYPKIDVLINNAGVILDQKQTNLDGFDLMFTTNYLGAVVLTMDLLSSLHTSATARIIETASISERIGNLRLEDLKNTASYPASKRALLMFTFTLARRLTGTGITVLAFHPGICPPEIPGKPPLMRRLLFATIATHADVVGLSLADLAINARFTGSTGAYMTIRGRKAHPSRASQNLKQQEQLWDETAKLLKQFHIFLPQISNW